LIIGLMLATVVLSPGAAAQPLGPSVADAAASPVRAAPALPNTPAGLNPLRALGDAGSLITGASDLGSAFRPPQLPVTPTDPSDPPPADAPGLSVAINIMLLLTVVSLVPSIMLMTTSFVRIIVVLALLRQALGTQSLPPTQVITGLALFMTALIMKPTIDRIWTDAVVPYQTGEIRSVEVLWERGSQPVRDFMFDQIEATGNWSSLYMVLNYQGIDTSEPQNMIREDIATTTLIPAYMLSELKTAFIMGFRVYLPFLVIDMVIASLLISMSMMMLPPVLISLPFKIMLFVLVDGWTLIVGSLLESFVVEGDSTRASAVTASVALCLVYRVVRPEPCPAAGSPAALRPARTPRTPRAHRTPRVPRAPRVLRPPLTRFIKPGKLRP
jgi:flagellar biosynthetic protein FliP